MLMIYLRAQILLPNFFVYAPSCQKKQCSKVRVGTTRVRWGGGIGCVNLRAKNGERMRVMNTRYTEGSECGIGSVHEQKWKNSGPFPVLLDWTFLESFSLWIPFSFPIPFSWYQTLPSLFFSLAPPLWHTIIPSLFYSKFTLTTCPYLHFLFTNFLVTWYVDTISVF